MNNKQMLNQPSEQLNALAHSFEHGLGNWSTLR